MVLFQFAWAHSLVDRWESGLGQCHGTIGWLGSNMVLEAIKISLGDTRKVCWLGDGSTLHVVELEECRDHHLVVKWQQKLLASCCGDVQLVNCIGSHQDESTIEFPDALCYEGNINRTSGEFISR
jgi:hypothetical protein